MTPSAPTADLKQWCDGAEAALKLMVDEQAAHPAVINYLANLTAQIITLRRDMEGLRRDT